MTVFDLYKRVKDVQQNLSLIGMGAMISTKDQFLELNKEQMTEGVSSKGVSIGKYQSKSYERFKAKAYPQSGGRVNLRYTGAFQEAMDMSFNTKKYRIFSRDGKEAKLTKKYGVEVFGLAPDQMIEYRREYFWPEFMKRIIRQIHG